MFLQFLTSTFRSMSFRRLCGPRLIKHHKRKMNDAHGSNKRNYWQNNLTNLIPLKTGSREKYNVLKYYIDLIELVIFFMMEIIFVKTFTLTADFKGSTCNALYVYLRSFYTTNKYKFIARMVNIAERWNSFGKIKIERKPDRCFFC